MNWASIVASAAPKTPMYSTRTKTRSIATFSRQATIMKYSGVRESPRARSIAEA